MKTKYTSDRGSVLLVAMIFAIIIASAAASYLQLTMTSVRIANRSFHGTAAMNIAESGLEEAMWSVNQMAVLKNANAFDGWSVSGAIATNTFAGFPSLGQNTTGRVKVYFHNYNHSLSDVPTIVARSIISVPNASAVEKWIEVKLGKRSRYSSGLVARKSITFSGTNPFVDSWDSDPDQDPTTDPVLYSSTTARDGGSIGGVDIDAELTVQNADIWGKAAVSSASSLAAIQVGPQGRVGPYGTELGKKPGASTDFTASLEVEAQPAGTSATSIKAGTTLVGSSDPNAPTVMVFQSIGFNNDTLRITGYVTLVLTAPAGTDAISIGGGSGSLEIGGVDAKDDPIPTAVQIYTAGNISITGNGVANGYTNASGTFVNGQPQALEILGTCTTVGTQSITMTGNGNISALINAPNANLEIKGGGSGNGNAFGAFIANTIKLTGGTCFHFDEAAKRYGKNNPWGISSWRELYMGADRAAYAGKL